MGLSTCSSKNPAKQGNEKGVFAISFPYAPTPTPPDGNCSKSIMKAALMGMEAALFTLGVGEGLAKNIQPTLGDVLTRRKFPVPNHGFGFL